MNWIKILFPTRISRWEYVAIIFLMVVLAVGAFAYGHSKGKAVGEWRGLIIAEVDVIQAITALETVKDETGFLDELLGAQKTQLEYGIRVLTLLKERLKEQQKKYETIHITKPK